MQHSQEARERLTLGYWIVLAGVVLGVAAMVIPVRSGDVDSASLIETWSVSLVFGLPILGSGALAYAAWGNGRAVVWPIVPIGALVALFGLMFGVSPEEGTAAGVGAWVLLGSGLLLFGGGVNLSVVRRRLRMESAVEAKVRDREQADVMPAPVAALPPEGWYRDPRDPTRSRWWDGSRWTDATRHGAAGQEVVPTA